MIHCYADDSQVYISFSPNNRAEQLAVVRNMEDCIRDIHSWMLNNDLKFNDDKTEFLIISSSQQLKKSTNNHLAFSANDNPLFFSTFGSITEEKQQLQETRAAFREDHETEIKRIEFTNIN
ncbi:unnamed protein product [Porites evermanni]|uniref:Reverse transcriptase domain-containing protein n=1 Tax=Porites evermanni TaxID=104178 RepID=A0ABN8PDE5_9CNID|nr:unnamed protein product [Porites evermanni]